MRLNQYLAASSNLSRRAADAAINAGRVQVNGQAATLGTQISENDTIELDGTAVTLPASYSYVVFHKPVGYITSRSQQGNSPTIYDLLPNEYFGLKPVGRLDKDSSGLLLLTNDGNLANRLTHPSHQKEKVYQVQLSRNLTEADRNKVEKGVRLEDGTSRFRLSGRDREWTVAMTEGRNRQIRRTFEALGYRVIRLHRTQFGLLQLGNLARGTWREATAAEVQP